MATWFKFVVGLLLVVHFLVVVFLTIVVLMQRTKEGGMGAAFGAGVTESLFGASSGNVLSKITVWTAVIFFATSLSMAVIFSHMMQGDSIARRDILKSGGSGLAPQDSGTMAAPAVEVVPSDGGTATEMPRPDLPPPPEKGAPVPPGDAGPGSQATEEGTVPQPAPEKPDDQKPPP